MEELIKQSRSSLNKGGGTNLSKSSFFHINDNDLNKPLNYKNNVIKQSKYNAFTFFPKSLLFQFVRLANCYFLFIAIIQSIPIISPLGAATAWAPIIFVLLVSIIRDGLEDLARHKYDNILNSEPVLVYRNNQWEESVSGTLRIGELVVVKEDNSFPADLILLDSNLAEGVAFIETGTLDGEKTLKNKIANARTAGLFNNGTWTKKVSVSGNCRVELPNPNLYHIEGSLELEINQNGPEGIKIPIDAKQLLLKGAILKNTEWIIGFVVYTGHNTKLILNSKKPRLKFSKIESLMSKLLIVVLIMQICLCVICAILFGVYYHTTVQYIPYLPNLIVNITVDSVLNFFTYILLLNTMIPISLIITLEIAKVVQGYLISNDVELYSFIRKKFCKAASISLNEELGQVNFIFSDKTGTLTCNRDVCYEFKKDNDKEKDKDKDKNLKEMQKNNIDEPEETRRLREEMEIKSFGPKFMIEFAQSRSLAVDRTKYDGFAITSEANKNVYLDLQDEAAVVNEFWKILSIGNECVVEDKTGKEEYSGMSPDDIELVKTANLQGYAMMKSNSSTIKRIKIGNEEKEFEILKVLEFSSDRKRMSIIFRDGNLIKLYTKGADSEIKKRLHSKNRKSFVDQAKYYVDYFSAQGYRTLLCAIKLLDEKEWEDWNERYKKAELEEENKADKLNELCEEIESGIYVIGATIVEDKLQDEVPETIRDCRLAGIRVWMLTGDKLDTAYNIGLSCNLISKNLKNFIVCGDKGDTLDKLIKEFKSYCDGKNKIEATYSILIDAIALTKVLASKEQTEAFVKIAYYASSVICCRVSPLQKSEVVKIMKNFDKTATTLSIGDGGNDVSMIMEAHIGVGVYGEEGMRAVQAGDFSIGEFKFLRRLLMFHGRTNNIRVSEMILYFFYKNFVFTLTHFYFMFYNNASGQTIIDDWFISLFNLLFTSLPLGVRAVGDHDVKPEDGAIINKMMPFMYRENRDKPIFTKVSYCLSLTRGVCHGLINYFFVIYIVMLPAVDNQGNTADLWYSSVLIYTNIILIVTTRLLIVQKFHTWVHWSILLFISGVCYWIFLIAVHHFSMFNSRGTMAVAFNSGRFWLAMVLVVVICGMIDIATSSIDMFFRGNITNTLRMLVKEKGTLNNLDDLPDNILRNLDEYDQYAQNLKGNNDLSRSHDYKTVNIKDLDKIDNIELGSFDNKFHKIRETNEFIPQKHNFDKLGNE